MEGQQQQLDKFIIQYHFDRTDFAQQCVRADGLAGAQVIAEEAMNKRYHEHRNMDGSATVIVMSAVRYFRIFPAEERFMAQAAIGGPHPPALR